MNKFFTDSMMKTHFYVFTTFMIKIKKMKIYALDIFFVGFIYFCTESNLNFDSEVTRFVSVGKFTYFRVKVMILFYSCLHISK